MIAFALGRNAKATHTKVGETVFVKEIWLETAKSAETLSPTVSLIRQAPNYVLEPHMHRENQFQVVVGGSGRMGTHELRPYCVHYAGAYSAYGPLEAGPEGLVYFTIRPEYDTYMVPVAGSRGLIPRGPKRHAMIDVDRAPAVGLATPLPLAHDGLGIEHLVVKGDSTTPVQVPQTAAGSFVVMLAGQGRIAGQTLDRLDVCFVTPEEKVALSAEGGDVEALFLHCPAKAREYS